MSAPARQSVAEARSYDVRMTRSRRFLPTARRLTDTGARVRDGRGGGESGASEANSGARPAVVGAVRDTDAVECAAHNARLSVNPIYLKDEASMVRRGSVW